MSINTPQQLPASTQPSYQDCRVTHNQQPSQINQANTVNNQNIYIIPQAQNTTTTQQHHTLIPSQQSSRSQQNVNLPTTRQITISNQQQPSQANYQPIATPPASSNSANLVVSETFKRCFEDQKALLIGKMMMLLIVGLIGLFAGRPQPQQDDMQLWQQIATVFLLLKVAYYLVLLLTSFSQKDLMFMSKRVKELRTAEQNIIYETDFLKLSNKDRNKRISDLSTKVSELIYQRDKCQTSVFNILLGFSVILIGIGIYIVCESKTQMNQTMFPWMIISFVVLSFDNIYLFGLVCIPLGILLIIIILIGYYPYRFYKYCKNKKKQQNVQEPLLEQA